MRPFMLPVFFYGGQIARALELAPGTQASSQRVALTEIRALLVWLLLQLAIVNRCAALPPRCAGLSGQRQVPCSTAGRLSNHPSFTAGRRRTQCCPSSLCPAPPAWSTARSAQQAWLRSRHCCAAYRCAGAAGGRGHHQVARLPACACPTASRPPVPPPLAPPPGQGLGMKAPDEAARHGRWERAQGLRASLDRLCTTLLVEAKAVLGEHRRPPTGAADTNPSRQAHGRALALTRAVAGLRDRMLDEHAWRAFVDEEGG